MKTVMNTEKVKNVVAWVLSVLLGLSFLMAGWPKVMPGENMVRRFENWGYSAEFTVLIGILELLGGLLVLLPKTAFYGALLVAILMVGAAYTHLSTGIGSPMFAMIYLAIAVAVMVMRYRSAWLIRGKSR